MKKPILVIVLFLCGVTALSANTLFLYSYELLDGENQDFSTAMNQGMMEEFFETPFIAFDNIAENNKMAFEPSTDLNDFLLMAKKGGAHYFLAVNSVSHEKKMAEESGEMDSEISYFLYDAKTSELLGFGALSKTVVYEKKAQIERSFAEIGREIVRKVLTLFPEAM